MSISQHLQGSVRQKHAITFSYITYWYSPAYISKDINCGPEWKQGVHQNRTRLCVIELCSGLAGMGLGYQQATGQNRVRQTGNNTQTHVDLGHIRVWVATGALLGDGGEHGTQNKI